MYSKCISLQVRQQAFTNSTLGKVTLDCIKNEGVSQLYFGLYLDCILTVFSRSGAFSKACTIQCYPLGLWIPFSSVFTVFRCAGWPRCVQMPPIRPRKWPRPQSSRPTGRFFGPVVLEGLHNLSLRVLSMWPRSNFKHRQAWHFVFILYLLND